MTRPLYDYDEAAEELRIEKSWLKRHIKRLPHVDRLGGRVFFTDDDLDRIIAAHHYDPPVAQPRAVAEEPIPDLTPLPSRRRA